MVLIQKILSSKSAWFALQNKMTFWFVIQTSERNGNVVGAICVDEGDETMLITNEGVKLIKMGDEEQLISIARIIPEDEEELGDDGEVVEGEVDTPEKEE